MSLRQTKTVTVGQVTAVTAMDTTVKRLKKSEGKRKRRKSSCSRTAGGDRQTDRQRTAHTTRMNLLSGVLRRYRHCTRNVCNCSSAPQPAYDQSERIAKIHSEPFQRVILKNSHTCTTTGDGRRAATRYCDSRSRGNGATAQYASATPL